MTTCNDYNDCKDITTGKRKLCDILPPSPFSGCKECQEDLNSEVSVKKPMKSKCSAFYIGGLKNHMRHGNGIYTSSNGNSYTGEWKEDMKDGNGTFKYANGNSYVGEYKNNKKHGNGIYTYGDTGYQYTGGWKDDKKHGKGIRTTRFGTWFEEWKDDDLVFFVKDQLNIHNV